MDEFLGYGDWKCVVRKVTIMTLVISLCSFLCPVLSLSSEPTHPKILLLNSYHQGYSWSDNVMNGIESSIYHQFPEAQINIEYLDTKRNSSSDYMEKLSELFEKKYRPGFYDLIIASDDNGINFALENRDQFFGDVPLVFCGANSTDINTIQNYRKVTGVREYSDIEFTIELALRLLPDTDNIYVVNDKTVTGKKIGEELDLLTKELSRNIDFHYIEDLPLPELRKEVESIDGNSIILLLAYLRDRNGIYYEPRLTAKTLSEASSIPIFSVWDFFFNHGIVGGLLTSGYLHGEAAGELAVRILEGKAAEDIPIVANGGNRLMLDDRQLERFRIDDSRIPQEAIIKNITYQKQKNVLALFSYTLTNNWNATILEGIQEEFLASGQDIKMSVEFMDTKRFSDKAYLARLSNLYQMKYKHQQFDAVIVSDDNAFQFIQRNRELFLRGIPIVFCGVNYLENPQNLPRQNITGIMESYDILGTITLGVDLFPETKKLFVINDQSTSGKANRIKLKQAAAQLPIHLDIEYCGNVSMQELLKNVSNLDADSLILLMSFTMDRNNQRFTYENSLNLIHNQANRPILGFWDFYLGEGIVGGVITSGTDQGKSAASMVLDILSGERVTDIPVMEVSPVQPSIDFRYLEKFEWSEIEFPSSYKVLNRSYSFFERYKNLVYISLSLLLLLLVLILAQALKIRVQKREQQQLTEQAETDDLTGAKSRNFFLSHLEEQMRVCQNEKTILSICYMDIDNLKIVNDTYGHPEGDKYILQVIAAIRKFIREDDVLCRIGGDEFVISLAGRSEEKIASFAEDINAELMKRKREQQIVYTMEVSYGNAVYDISSEQTAHDLLQQADIEMYKNKQNKKSEF